MSLTKDQIRWVAHLSRLQISDPEVEKFTRDLNSIIEYINQLQQVNTEEVEPLAHALDLQNVLREDVSEQSLAVDKALSNAPQRQGDFFRVPAVLD